MWPNPQETADLVTFIGEFFNGKHHFFVQCYIVLLTVNVSSDINFF